MDVTPRYPGSQSSKARGRGGGRPGPTPPPRCVYLTSSSTRREVPQSPRRTGGRMRPAGGGDTKLLAEWCAARHAAAHSQHAGTWTAASGPADHVPSVPHRSHTRKGACAPPAMSSSFAPSARDIAAGALGVSLRGRSELSTSAVVRRHARTRPVGSCAQAHGRRARPAHDQAGAMCSERGSWLKTTPTHASGRSTSPARQGDASRTAAHR